jgi:hypothetical protein
MTIIICSSPAPKVTLYPSSLSIIVHNLLYLNPTHWASCNQSWLECSLTGPKPNFF